MITDHELPEIPAPPHEEAIDPELIAALGQLTSEQREVVLLRFVADLPIDVVADLTDRSAGAVRSLQHRAIAQLTRAITAGRDAAGATADEPGRP